MFKNAIHYEASNKPIMSKISADFNFDTCPIVSAGHPKHEYTTGYSQNAIFDQFGFNDV